MPFVLPSPAPTTTVQELLDGVVSEASFDVTPATALRWLNRRWRTMVGRSRCYRMKVALGMTVSGVAFYPASVLELFELTVAGVPYMKARRPDVYANSQGRLVWEGQGEIGLIVADADAFGVQGLTLIPTPSTAGLAIDGFAAMYPADLTVDAQGDLLLAAVLGTGGAVEVVEGLIAGAMAIGYMRESNPGLRDSAMMQFDAVTEELRRTSRRRYRGSGPTQIRL